MGRDTSHFLLHRDRITIKNFSPVICLGSSLINIQKRDTNSLAICKEWKHKQKYFDFRNHFVGLKGEILYKLSIWWWIGFIWQKDKLIPSIIISIAILYLSIISNQMKI